MTLEDLLPAGMPLNLLAELGVGAANLVALVMLYRAFSPTEVVGARARAHARRRKELRDAVLATPRSQRRQKPVTVVRSVLERLKLTRGDEVRKSSERLAGAGWRTADAMTLFLGFRLGSPPLFGLTVWLLAPLMVHHLNAGIQDLAAVGGAAFGVLAPSLFVDNAAKKRRQKIQKQLPDALDLFVICAEAGLGLDAAFVRVSRELASSAHELSDELGLTAIELSFLPSRRDALANLGRRVDSASIRSLVNTLSQTEKYGTPLAQSLRVLANEFRNDRMMKAEEKAARLPATLTVPMICFILPPLFVVLVGPAVVQVMAVVAHNKVG
jgi:tight adherence protein C